MNIQASCKLDCRAVRALTHVSIYKKHRPRTRLIIRLCLSGLFLSLAIGGLFIRADSAPILLCVSLLLLAISLAVHFLLPKKQYKSLAQMQEAENHYLFKDESMTVSTNNDCLQGESTFHYALLVRAYETDDYFFLCQTATQVFVVDKRTLVGGTADDLSRTLTNVLKEKYIRCDY